MKPIDALDLQAGDLGALLDELADDEWDRPTRCSGWTVKDVAAHCESMLVRLVGANAEPVEVSVEIDRVGYYAYDPDGPREDEPHKSFSDSIRDRVLAETEGRSGQDIRDAYHEAVADAVVKVRQIPDDRVVKRSGHPRMRFDEFVATRVLELGIHAMDIGHATRRGERIHPAAVPVVTDIIAGRLSADLPANLGWDDRTFILTGSGRRALLSNERHVLGALADRFPVFR